MFKKKELNLLEGPLFPKILSFAIPLIITNLIQTLYNSADMLIVGLSNVSGAIGAIGTTSPLIHLILNVFNGLSVGCGIIVARFIGENSPDKVNKAVHTSIITALYSGIFCMLIGYFLSTPILAKMGDSGHILELASTYTKIYFLGVPFLAVTNFLIAIFRAKGDTETPLKVLMSTGLENVILNFIFVVFCKKSVDGVALATSISNITSMIVLWIILSKDNSVCRLNIKNLKLDIPTFWLVVYNGVPSGIQASMFSFSNLIIQSSIININNITYPGGSFIIDGNSSAASIEGIASTVTGSIMQTSMTFTSQHYGAKSYKRLKKVILNCYIVGFALATISSVLLLSLKTPLLHLYISEPKALEAGYTRMVSMLSLYFLYGSVEVGQGLLRGLNKSIQTTVISVLGIGISRIIWVDLVVSKSQTLKTLFVSYPLSWFLTGAVYLILILNTLKHIDWEKTDKK